MNNINEEVSCIVNEYYRSHDKQSIFKLRKLLPKEKDNESLVELAIAEIFYDLGEYRSALLYLNAGACKNINLRYYELYALVFIEYREYELALGYYEKYLKNASISITDLTILSLLEYLCDRRNLGITENSKYFVTKPEKVFMNEYQLAIKRINSGELDKSLFLFDSINSKFSHLRFPVKGIRSLLKNAIYKKESKAVESFSDIVSRAYDFINEGKLDYVVDCVEYMIMYFPNHVNSILSLIYQLVINGKNAEALSLLDMLCNKVELIKKHEEQIRFIKTSIDEKYMFDNLSEEQQAQFYAYKNEGDDFLLDGEYESAYEAYLAGLEETELNVFNYYAGKCLNSYGRVIDGEDKVELFENALKYFEQYVENGGSKLNKAYMYMSKIYKLFDDTSRSGIYSRKREKCDLIADNRYHSDEDMVTDLKQKLSKIKGNI